MKTQELTNKEEEILDSLSEKITSYIDEVDLCANEVDNGFYYDYGSITNAWHSQPDVEFDEDWGVISLGNSRIPDYVLERLVAWCKKAYSRVSYTVDTEYDSKTSDARADWNWYRSKEEVFVECLVLG